jgi:diaminopimelate decarboxylase
MDLLKLADKYGTPLYVYDGKLIRQKYQEIKKFFPWKNLKIYYAMKANYNPHILKLLEKEGACIDAVSPGDVLMAKKVGFSSSRILFTANKITDKEMEEVQKENVLFNIGSLSRLEKYGKAYPGNKVCLRFNPDVVAGAHKKIRTGGEATKFGILLADLEKVKKIITKHALKVVGIHEHTGSGIPETVSMVKGMKNILAICIPENFPHLEFVDFGGGFKIPYHPDETLPDYRKFGGEVVELFKKTCKLYHKDLEMYFEPGKYLVGDSGFLIVQVNTLKKNKSRLIAGTNSGFPQLIRPMFYEAYHHISNLSNPRAKKMKYDISGNICETGDCFAVNRPIAQIREDDFLAIHTAGAYCYAMGGVYNLRPMPSEVLVDKNDKLIRRRLSNKKLVAQIIKECSL